MRPVSILVLASLAAACGARSALELDESPVGPVDASSPLDGGVVRDAGFRRDSAFPLRDTGPLGCEPVSDGCVGSERCGDGADNNCNGLVDEDCACEPGAVQSCFAGPPGRRDVGACQDGSQVCGADRRFGPCEGGILPNPEVCTGRDDLCNGCSDNRICPIDCPSPGDPRVPEGAPFAPYTLRGRDFYVGPADSWRWRIEGGICDRLAPNLESYTLTGARSEVATFTPRLSGDYRVTLEVGTPDGGRLSCSWVVHVGAPGLRVEMCYPESETQDLDLYLHRPDDTTDWYPDAGATAFTPIPEASCGWHNCEAAIRLDTHPVTGAPVTRADWGYADSPLARCENGPLGDQWRTLVGACPNPRLDIDNNLSEGIGLPENINVDQPRDGETFRIMVHNFTGELAHPVVNVYCGGTRIATFGQEPDTVNNFMGPDGFMSIGAMWRVSDVTVHVDEATGETTGCDAVQLHRPGLTEGFYLTLNDPVY